MRQSPGRPIRHRVEVSSAHGGAFERDNAAALEEAVQNCFGEVGVVQDAAPAAERLVGGEDHGATAAVAHGEDMEEDVGGVGAVGQIANRVEIYQGV